jgi:peptide/nickel transport system substrate-binding protein
MMRRACGMIAAMGAGLATSVASAQENGGTAVIAIDADPGDFNPGITTGANVHVVADSMFNGLVALDETLSPAPDLATSWEISDDSTEYTFHLAEDVTWHHGEPFTSDDVKFTFENVLFQYHSRTKAGLGDVVDEILAPDEHTVVFRMKEPYGPLLQRLDGHRSADPAEARLRGL